MADPDRINSGCPWRQASDLHQKVLALWRKNQALAIQLANLKADLADTRRQQALLAKQIYELYGQSSDGLDGQMPKKETRPENSQ